METKVCSKCKRELPKNTDYFFKRKENKDGLQGVCKECKGHFFTDKLKYKTRDGYRICYKCDEEYELNDDNFYKSTLGRDGFRTTCKNCDNKSNVIYRQNNKEKRAEQWRNWYEKNKDYKNEYDKKYREENKVKISKYNQAYQRYYRGTKRGKAIRKKHYHIREAKLRELEYNFTEDDWLKCKEHFDYCCAYCGERVDILTQDHFVALNNGGTYTKDNIIPCCFSCNSSKQDKDFYKWYKDKEFYSEDRADNIGEYLGIQINYKE